MKNLARILFLVLAAAFIGVSIVDQIFNGEAVLINVLFLLLVGIAVIVGIMIFTKRNGFVLKRRKREQ